jgi:hypothetical protein
MTTPDINTIKAMPKNDLAALNNQMAQKLATRVVGLMFLKLAVPGVLGVLARKALITAAKRV